MSPRLRDFPIERKLAALVCAILVPTVLVISAAGYSALNRALIEAAHERLERVSDQIAGAIGARVARSSERTARVASAPAMVALVRSGGTASREEVAALLDALAGDLRDRVLVEVRDADDHRLLTAGNATLAMPADPATPPSTAAPAVGPLIAADSVAYYAAQAPVRAGELIIGRVLMWEPLTETPESRQLLVDLIGPGGAFAIGNIDGSKWSDLRVVVPAPPVDAPADEGLLRFRAADGARHIGVLQPIPHAPWQMLFELPLASVLASSRSLLLRLAVASLILLLLAAGIAWFAGRRITRPLQELTDAARGLANGTAGARVRVRSADDVGQLAGAFNIMADRIERGQHALSEANGSLRESISEREESQMRLARYAAELERSNAELQHFAYVASHDLQEPLRMVRSYTQLLAKRYRGQLDADADEFIDYAVDGAARMQTLISDLLTYSRIDSRARPLQPTDTAAVVDQVLGDMEGAIRDAGATVERGALPTVRADPTQLARVFQNLIGNALKFRGAEPPRVRIEARRDAGAWIFSVADNGIGIPAEYSDRIFVIFQRLHGQGEYEGTGIGLAVCKKTVERLGGRIWVESTAGAGTTFHFSIPDSGAIGDVRART